VPTAPPPQSRWGILFAVAAYAIWGAFPLYFIALAPASAIEVVAFRILMSLALCALLIAITRGWGRFTTLLRDRRTSLLMLVAAVAIYLNWLVYIFAALTGHVIEASLGYFINPLVTVLLGVIVLRERVRPAQWAALAIALVAIVVIVVGYGAFPWIAVVLAVTFAAYGLVKRIVGPRVDALGGLTLETAWLAPLAVAQLVLVVALGGGLAFGQHGLGHTLAMLAAGVVTTVPLLLFAAGARRIPLVALGMAQFLTPVLQFLVGWLLLDEAMPLERWVGFGLVWVALVVLMTDMIVASRPPRRASLERV
jgi:chloramphenicol-sensitive protein RarD